MVTPLTLLIASPLGLSINKSTETGLLPCCVDADKRKLPNPVLLAGGVDNDGVDGGVGAGVLLPVGDIKNM